MEVYSCSLFRSSFPWVAILGSFIAFAHSSGFGLLTILLTSSALILCPVIVSRSKSASFKVQNEAQTVSEQEMEEVPIYQKKEDIKRACDCLLSSSEALSDSDSAEHTTSSEDYENYWVFREDLSHSTPYSDDSISDEESLIEIELPTGQYVDPNRVQLEQQQSWYGGFQQKWSDCSFQASDLDGDAQRDERGEPDRD